MNGEPPGAAWETGRWFRRRRLPHDAEIIVQTGQEVRPDTIIAHLPPADVPTVLDLQAELGVRPADAAALLVVQEGDVVEAGAVLAERRTLLGLRRAAIAPHTGRLTLVSAETGVVVLRPEGAVAEAHALVTGWVAAIERSPQLAITLEARGVALAGAQGFGAAAWGPLVLWEEPDPPASAAAWAPWQDALVLVRQAATTELMRAAAESGAAALIAPGTSATLPGMDWDAAAPAHLPLLLLYGPLTPMLPETVMHLFRPLAGTTAAITGAEWGTSPELLLTGDTAEVVAGRLGPPDLAPGRHLVVLRGPLAGEVGQLVTTASAHLFESEWRGPAAQVRTEHGTTTWVPMTSVAPLPTETVA